MRTCAALVVLATTGPKRGFLMRPDVDLKINKNSLAAAND